MYPPLEIIQTCWAEVRTEDGKKTFHIKTLADGKAELEARNGDVGAIPCAPLAEPAASRGSVDPLTCVPRMQPALRMPS